MPELEELRRLFHEAVLVRGPYDEWITPGTGFPSRLQVSPFACWFFEHIPGIDPCGGDHGPDHLEAAHWIKRQTVEKAVAAMLPDYAEVMAELAEQDDRPPTLDFVSGAVEFIDWQTFITEAVFFAAWDPRNAVPACEKHHRRFDAHRMPTLVVPRRLVPDHVVEFVHDYGLETALEDRNPEEVYDRAE